MGQSTGGVIGRVIGVFAIIGFGLGLGALLFLWATDYFEPERGNLGSAIFGGLAIGALMIFALLSGVVVAALGGMHASNVAPNRDSAVTSGFVSGLIGHIVMISVIGGLLMAGFAALSPDEDAPSEAPLTAPAPDPECAEAFGADSPICRLPEPPDESVEENRDEDDGVDVEQLVKLGLGAIPAGVVGGLTAATLFSRKQKEN